jgi:hypothetical protein
MKHFYCLMIVASLTLAVIASAPSAPSSRASSSLQITATPVVSVKPTRAKAIDILLNGKLSKGYDLGLNSSAGRTDWLEVIKGDTGEICMRYPSGQTWGAVFIGVEKITPPPRAAKDFTGYRTLSVELRGQLGNERIEVGLKDNEDPDNGTETKRQVRLTKAYKRHTLPLSRFTTADLSKLHIVTEFVFTGDQPLTVCARSIRYLA